ncbi:hypothetical protein [Vibrio hangzhouensis]|uniref:hypothetical protein n=1 Tax=Vibrio hangzhouensis TaxID=462991 RepID=UPI001C9702B7|nr:hypothetical protein [Vibrio hangzhouensis]MBY6197741.1 hypothetical protein [Vibrio hangzhouensis]
MYELTLILSLMLGGTEASAEIDVNTRFTSVEECNKTGEEFAAQMKSADIDTIHIQCELD